MKQIFLKALKVVSIFLISFFVVTTISEATGYVKTASNIVNNPGSWTFQRFSHTFVAATDTVYMPINLSPGNPSLSDTISARVNLIFRGIATGNIDSISTATEIWTTSDTTGWWNGATRTRAFRGMWTITAVGVDSGVTIKTRNLTIRPVHGAPVPYMMVVVIGKAAVSGGVANKISNVVQGDVFTQ